MARKLIDVGDAATAYQVVRDAAPPANPYYRAETHFMAGWIALRFLADPATALEHFAHVDDGMTDPLTLARAAYWRGRALRRSAGLKRCARNTRPPLVIRPPIMASWHVRGSASATSYCCGRRRPRRTRANALLHAADILYIGEGDLVLSFVSDLAKESSDPAVIAGLGTLTERYHDAQAMLLIGKTALARGLPMDLYAFPDIGVPDYNPVGSKLDRCIVYSIVRTESRI